MSGIDLCLTSPDGIHYRELTENWSGTLSNVAQSGASRKLVCAWADMPAFTHYLLTANNTTLFTISYVIGADHPNFPGMFVTDVGIKPLTGIGSAEGDFSGDYAELDVTYKSLPFNASDPYSMRTETIEPAGEIIPLPKESIDLDDESGGDTHKAAYDDSLFIPYLKYSVQLHSVSTIPLGAIVGCQNKLSSSNMNLRFGGTTYTVPGDQVLYQGPGGLTKTTLSNGQVKYDVSHTFLIAPMSMNKVYDHEKTDENIMDRFVLPNTIKYTTADMSTLGI